MALPVDTDYGGGNMLPAGPRDAKDPKDKSSSSSSSSSSAPSSTTPSTTYTGTSSYVPSSAPAPAPKKPEKPAWMQAALDRVLNHQLESPEDKQDLADNLGVTAGALLPAAEETLTRQEKKYLSRWRTKGGRREGETERSERRGRQPAEPHTDADSLLRMVPGPYGSPTLSMSPAYRHGSVMREVRRADRERILGLDQPAEREKERQDKKEGAWDQAVEPMTWEEYQALDPRQRAAVDFNGALVAAVREDRANSRNLRRDATAQQKKDYRGALREMFGPERGSRIFAPQTVALLNELDIKDREGDLDDYLNLEVALTAKDLKHFEKPDMSHGATVGYTEAVNEAVTATPAEKLDEQIVDATLNLTRELAKSQRLIQDFRVATQREINMTVGVFGGTPQPIQTLPGWGDPGTPDNWTFDGYIQQNYSALSSLPSRQAREEQLARIRADLNDEQFQQFLTYVDVNTRQNMKYGKNQVLLDETPDGTVLDYIRPRKVRRTTGLLKSQREQKEKNRA